MSDTSGTDTRGADAPASSPGQGADEYNPTGGQGSKTEGGTGSEKGDGRDQPSKPGGGSENGGMGRNEFDVTGGAEKAQSGPDGGTQTDAGKGDGSKAGKGSGDGGTDKTQAPGKSGEGKPDGSAPDKGSDGKTPDKGSEKAPDKSPDAKAPDKSPDAKDGPKPGDKPAQPADKTKPADKNELDNDSKKFIKDTQEAYKKVQAMKDGPEKQKAMKELAEKTARTVLDKYWKDTKVKDVVYDPKLKSGLEAQRQNKDGKVFVSEDYVKKIDFFARRVIQAGHETKHIEQYKTGKDNESAHTREFKANSWSATATEKPGTGRMPENMRKDYAKEAVKHYNDMTPDQQKTYRSEKESLEKRFGL